MAKVAAEIGSTANQYQILAKLAVGGMAEIFLARGASVAGVERYCVLKRILRERASDAQFVQMFVDEARLAAQLQHPNIASVYDVGMLGDSYFFTMEYVHGETIRSLLQRAQDLHRPVPLACALTIIAGAAAGLHHAHERHANDGRPLGIVHRDVSPANVMVSFEGHVKVVDFGVAKAADRAVETKSGTVKGKISYLSPEQCKGVRVDRRSDLFSLGIVMWEMLTGARLYRRTTDFENMTAIVNEPPPPPSARRSEIPRAVDAIVLRLLAKSVTDRFQTAAAVLEAIEDASMRAGTILSTSAVSRLVHDLFGARTEPWLEFESATLPHEAVTLMSRPVPGDVGPGASDAADGDLENVFDLSSSTLSGDTHELSLSDLMLAMRTGRPTSASPQVPTGVPSTTIRDPSPRRPASHGDHPVAPSQAASPLAAPATPPGSNWATAPQALPSPPVLPAARPGLPWAPGAASAGPPFANPNVPSIPRSPAGGIAIASPSSLAHAAMANAGFAELRAGAASINSTLLGVGAPPSPSAAATAVMATPNGLFARGAPPPSDSMSTTNEIITELTATGSDLTPLPVLHQGFARSRSADGSSSQALTQARPSPWSAWRVARRRTLAIVGAIAIGVVGARLWRHGDAAPRSGGAHVTYTPAPLAIPGADIVDASIPAKSEVVAGSDASAAAPPEGSIDASATPPDEPFEVLPAPAPTTPTPTSPAPSHPAQADPTAPRRPPVRPPIVTPVPPTPPGGGSHLHEQIHTLYRKEAYGEAVHLCSTITLPAAQEENAKDCLLSACHLGELVQAKRWLRPNGCALADSLIATCNNVGKIDLKGVLDCPKRR